MIFCKIAATARALEGARAVQTEGLAQASSEGRMPLRRQACAQVSVDAVTIEIAADEDEFRLPCILAPGVIRAKIDQFVHRLEHEEAVILRHGNDALGTEEIVAMFTEIALQESAELFAVKGVRVDERV
jgi:hypothetical protein